MKLKISKEDVQNYAMISGDYNPIHLDDDYAKELGYSGGIAHGMLTMAKLWSVVSADYFLGKETLGTYTITFSAPLYTGDTMNIEVNEKKYHYAFKGSVKKQLVVKGTFELKK